MRTKALFGALLLTMAMPIAASDVLSLKVSPEMAVQPAWITVQVLIEPNADNRTVTIVAESDDYYRSSQIQLDGDKASRVSVFQYKDLPAGDYEVRGVLIGRDGSRRAVVRRTVTVMP